MAADGSLQAVAVHLLDVLGHLQGQPAPGAAGDDRAGQHVRRHLVQGRGESQHLVGVETTRGDHLGQDRVSLGQGAGLVEQHHLPAGQGLQRATTLDDDTHVCGPGEPGHDGDRGGQEQRARRCDDQHRDGEYRVTADRPGHPGQDQRERDEVDGDSIGGAHERRRRRLGLLHQADHAGVGGFGGDRGRQQVDRLPRVDHAAAHVVAGDPLDRQRLTGQCRLVQHGSRQQPAVHRDDLSGADQ